MDGIHDAGGMHGFGPVERDDAPFHAPWELRVRAMMHALYVRGDLFNIDEMRRAIEAIPPAEYVRDGYFTRWLKALEALLVEKGALTRDELSAASPPVRRDDPAAAEVLMRRLAAFLAARAPAAPAARFRPGDAVRVRNLHQPGHTRAPRYVRGKQGVVLRVHGVYTFPDSNAHGRGQAPQPVYSVRFSARELWGEGAPAGDSVAIDLWESYLEGV